MFPDFSGSQKFAQNQELSFGRKVPTSSDSVLNVSGHATGPDKDILISDSRTCAKKDKRNESGTKMFRIRHECEKSLVTNCSLSAVSTAKWLSYYRIERRSTMSCYYGSKILGSQQSFLKETVICIVARCKKNMDYCFVPECNHAKESHESQFFRVFFCPPYLQDHGLLRSRNFATMATWRSNVSSL